MALYWILLLLCSHGIEFTKCQSSPPPNVQITAVYVFSISRDINKTRTVETGSTPPQSVSILPSSKKSIYTTSTQGIPPETKSNGSEDGSIFIPIVIGIMSLTCIFGLCCIAITSIVIYRRQKNDRSSQQQDPLGSDTMLQDPDLKLKLDETDEGGSQFEPSPVHYHRRLSDNYPYLVQSTTTFHQSAAADGSPYHHKTKEKETKKRVQEEEEIEDDYVVMLNPTATEEEDYEVLYPIDILPATETAPSVTSTTKEIDPEKSNSVTSPSHILVTQNPSYIRSSNSPAGSSHEADYINVPVVAKDATSSVCSTREKETNDRCHSISPPVGEYITIPPLQQDEYEEDSENYVSIPSLYSKDWPSSSTQNIYVNEHAFIEEDTGTSYIENEYI